LEQEVVTLAVREMDWLRIEDVGQAGEEPGAREDRRTPPELVNREAPLLPLPDLQGVPEPVRQELDGLGREGQECPRDHMPVALRNDSDGDAVPGLQGTGGALHLNRQRPGLRQEIAELHRLARPDLAHLVEANRRIPQPLDVGPRQRRLLPSPA
jgi:hypothetical protein